MRKYVKKQIPIHAFRWDGHINTLRFNIPPNDFYSDTFSYGETSGHPWLQIRTLEGYENCPISDYIIRGIHGEYYPCDPKIFKESYKEVK